MTRIRFRDDNRWAAESAAWRARGDSRSWLLADDAEGQAAISATPPAQPGDCWRIRWHARDGNGPLAGYDICCPKCGDVHAWTTASNCPRQKRRAEDGSEYLACPHNGISSCWVWTGSAEEGTLTASPSLHAKGACGWHGWLRNGAMVLA